MPADIGQNKAIAAAHRLLPHATHATAIAAHPYMFQDAIAFGRTPAVHAYICFPDNNPVRSYASRYFMRTTPGITVGYSAHQN